MPRRANQFTFIAVMFLATGVARGQVVEPALPFESAIDAGADWDVLDLTSYQPDDMQPDEDAPTIPPRRATPTRRRSRDRQARVPNMFGDVFVVGGQFSGGSDNGLASGDLPFSGGNHRVKVSENNKAWTHHRVFFQYHHFHNALQLDNMGFPPESARGSIDRYTFGVEKMFAEGLFSLEVRMPFTSQFSAQSNTRNLGIEGGKVGNIAILLKLMLLELDTMSMVAGIGLDTPTGSDVEGRIDGTVFTVQNEAFHLLPYIGATGRHGELAFWSAFAQLDLTANGNTVNYSNGVFPPQTVTGKYNDQNMFFLDVSAGIWLYDNPAAPWLTGLAGIAELHYSTTIQDTDNFSGQVMDVNVDIFNPSKRFDLVNLSAGIHAEIANQTTVRVVATVPVSLGDDRFVPFELQVQVNRFF